MTKKKVIKKSATKKVKKQDKYLVSWVPYNQLMHEFESIEEATEAAKKGIVDDGSRSAYVLKIMRVVSPANAPVTVKIISK